MQLSFSVLARTMIVGPVAGCRGVEVNEARLYPRLRPADTVAKDAGGGLRDAAGADVIPALVLKSHGRRRR